MRPPRGAVRGAVLCGLLLVVTSCGLPTDDGVHRSGQVQPDGAERRGSYRELPPGPQPGASPADIVAGFFEAQISAENQHAVSRDYLLPGTPWADDAGVTVYTGRRLDSPDGSPEDPGPLGYQVRVDKVGSIGPDGAAVAASEPVRLTEDVTLVRDPEGEWRLDRVPDGLLLSTETRDDAFRPYTVYFLPVGPVAPGLPHLVADRQLLPAGAGPDTLVRRVLAPPSAGLADSGTTAAPPEAGLAAPVTVDPTGAEALVDLRPAFGALPPPARVALAAQLTWTLRQVPDLLRVRLLVDGEPFEVAGSVDPIRLSTAFPEADPQGSVRAATALVGGEVRALQSALPPVLGSARSVQDVAVDPHSGSLALLSGPAEEPVLRVGARDGRLREVARGAGLSSPTWGDGSYGVWFLRAGGDPAVLVSDGGGVEEVPVPGLPTLDATATLRVSRDGARVALVSDGQLLLGRVLPDTSGRAPRVVDLRPLRRDGALAVDWVDATTLAVLVSDPRPLRLLSVDGVSEDVVNQPFQGNDAQSVAASGESALLVGTVSEQAASDLPAAPISAAPPQPSTSPAVPAATGGPAVMLYSGRPGQPFDPSLPDGRRPRYPG